jgi:CHAT domain-containing protein/Tfp pilus assembly protein PilF
VKTHRLLPRFEFFLKKIAVLVCYWTLNPAFGAPIASGDAAGPSPTPSAEHTVLAEKLASAANSAEQDSLIDNAEPALLRGALLRYALLKIAFQRSLEGKYVEAEKVDRMIIHVGTRLHDPAVIAAGQTMIGGVLRESGDYSEGLSMLRQAADYYDKQAGPSTEKTSVSMALGITYLYEGNFRRAFASLERSLKIATELHQREGIIPALNSMGEVLRAEGQPERALQFYERARKEVGDDSAWNMAFIFNNIGMAYEAMGENAKAADYLNRARAVAEKVEFQPRVASALTELGNIHLRAGEIEPAGNSYQQSFDLAVTLHDKSEQARALVGLANVARKNNDFSAALDHSRKTLGIYRSLQEHDSIARTQTLVGQILNSLGKAAEAHAAFEDAVSEIEQVRGQLAGGAEEAESYFADRIAPYQELVNLALKEHRDEEALVLSERASARALLDILAKGKSGSARVLDDSQKQRLRELDQRLAEANRQIIGEMQAGHPSSKRIESLRIALNHARVDHENFNATIANEPANPSPVTTASFDEMLRLAKTRKATLLKFVVTKDETFLFVLAGQDDQAALKIFPLGLTRDELAKRTASFRSLMAERGIDWQTPAGALYKSLLQKAEPALKNSSRLIIIPDGPLWDLPFQTLQSANKRCLIEDHTISYAPSITFLIRANTNRTNENANSERLLAVANPVIGEVAKSNGSQKILVSSGPQLMGEMWEPLPATETQARELKKLYDTRSIILTGANAREDVFKAQAADFDVIHLATHGVLNDRAPLYSYLLMSQENLAPGEDGLLEAWELMQMKLRARLAVLSACETARGKISEGEGVIGLSWALLAAGCPSAVVSQWKVDSASNTDLMLEFHRRYRKGAPTAEALRDASLALAKNPRYRHPFYWAPFVAIGD